MKDTIMYEDNALGGRLKYFNVRADSDYWDDVWDHVRLDRYYERALRGHLPYQLRRTFLRWVRPGSRVLEAGCVLADFTVAAHVLGFQAEGVDYASRVVERIGSRFPDIHFLVGDVRRLTDIPDETYDAVYSPGVCEHFEEGPYEVLHKTYRILKVGGIALVSTPCFNPFRLFLSKVGVFDNQSNGQFYQYAFSHNEMRSILNGIGFEVLQSESYGTWKTLCAHMLAFSIVPLGPLAKPVAYALNSIPLLKS